MSNQIADSKSPEKPNNSKDGNLICETGIGFSQRDKNVKQEEDKGYLEFKVIKNDGTPENLKLLTDLKNIISKQLPKMPKEYIVRLVFDRKHESMVIIKSNTHKVMGGVCYRPNYEQHFIEIAFLAISSMEQVKGYGTRLMNKLKDHCRSQKLNYFLTYADNNAIGYFKKQGFSTQIKMEVENWKELIKDYDGGTLMEAYCNPIIEYSKLSEVIKKQKETFQQLTSQFLNIKRRYKYADFEKCLKKPKQEESIYIDTQESNNIKANNKNAQILNEKIFNSIPGLLQSGWTYKDYLNICSENNVNLMTQCRNIIQKIKQNKNSWPFLTPVNKSEVVDYYDVIKDPMDLQTLETNLNKGLYNTKDKFVVDLRKIFSNAKIYNKPNTIYHKYAKDIEASIEDDIRLLRDD